MNRIIKQVSAIGLLVLVVTIGANAQSSQQYRAQIPFDFEAAGRLYAAGEYSVGPVSHSIAIRDLRTGKMRLLGQNAREGTGNWDVPGTLTFQMVDGTYRLIKIKTATFEKNIKVAKTKGDLAKANLPKPVEVALK